MAGVRLRLETKTRASRLRGALLLASCLVASVAPLHADPLVLVNVGNPTSVGAGQGKRAIWTNAGTVGGVGIDLVATLTTATQNHNFTTSSNRASITSVGQDDIWVQWRIFQAGTYDINTDSGGVPVAADVHVQLNDVDGPNNEQAYIPVCDGTVRWVRIDQGATTGRTFGTVAGRPEIFSLIGDQNYNSEPASGVEILYPNTSTFFFGRTADTNYFIRVDNPSYADFNTFDFQCADFRPLVAVDDAAEGDAGSPVTVSPLDNDSATTSDPSGVASEFARQSVNLVAPGTAINVVTDTDGDVVGFTVPGEGDWSYDDSTGELTFGPAPGFVGDATEIDYTFDGALGGTSNAATVSLTYPGIGVVKSAILNDDIVADGAAQVGETITYTYSVRSIGSLPIENVTVTETGFTGNGVTPVPAYQSGDLDADSRLDSGETWIYSATYTIVAADITAGSVGNQATAAGQTAGGTVVSDLSDSTNAADGNGTGTYGPGANNNDPTVSVLDSALIDAIDDAPAPVAGIAGNASLANAFDNDTLNGVAVDPADIDATITTPASHAGVTLDVNTGVISVAPSTPAGTYTIVYEICETLNPSNCDSATITVDVTAAAIDAVDDNPAAVGGIAGNASLVNAFDNDELDGSPVVPADITATIVTPSGHAGVTMDTATGVVSVAPGTSAATYTIVYRICENLNPANCDTATITVAVDAAAIDAVDDATGAPVDTAQDVVGALNVLDNDTLDGVPVGVGDVTVSAVGALPAGFSLQMHGSVDIAQGTPSDTYTFDYQICEVINPANCDTATVTIVVEKSVPSIEGIVFFDANGNGQFDINEQRLEGYIVELRQNGVVVKSTLSAADGSYHIFDFTPGGGYEIVFLDPATEVAVGYIPNLTFAIDEVMTDQNQPIDPSGVLYNVVTRAPLAGAVMEMQTALGVTLPVACLLPGQQPQTTAANGRYRFDVVPGAAAECPAAETEYRLAITTYPAGMEPTASVIAPAEPGALDATTCPVDAVPGGACQLSASSDAPATGNPTRYYMAFLLQPGDPNVVNNHIPLDPLPSIPANGLSITKRASVAVARRDEIVSYVIVAANDNPFAAGPFEVLDRMPAGFAFVPGTATIDNVAATPTVAGRSIAFRNVRIPARGRVEIRLSARIGADVVPGDHANQAVLVDPATGQALTATARAIVRVEAEHLFDCGEIIGKVFDDRNRDGAQDDGEPGLPAVRIATVNGVLITTDRHGRFSVPCAELPDAAIGSNFILKLDPRTLPDGYGLTTENPRVVRLTPGKVTKLNFGATASNRVEVKLTGDAFQRGAAEPTSALRNGIGRLADVVDKKGSVLSITYSSSGEPQDLVRARMSVVGRLIASIWLDRGKPLPVEIRIVGAQ